MRGKLLRNFQVLGAIVSIVFLVFTIWSLIEPSGVTGQLVNNFVVSQNASMTDDQGLEENREGRFQYLDK